MTAAACHTLAKRGLTLADIQFLDHLIKCGVTTELEVVTTINRLELDRADHEIERRRNRRRTKYEV